MRYLLIILLLAGCRTPEQLVKKALRKDSEVLKKVQQAQVVYISDTTYIQTEGRVDTIIKTVPVEVPVIQIKEVRTGREKRLDFKFERAELERYKLITDSFKLKNKLLKAEIDLLKAEESKTKHETRKIKRENRGAFMQFLAEWWWLIILLAIATLFILKRFIRIPVN